MTGWIPVVTRFGGTHHGCYLPHEGASDIAYALLSFPSLAAYEVLVSPCTISVGQVIPQGTIFGQILAASCLEATTDWSPAPQIRHHALISDCEGVRAPFPA